MLLAEALDPSGYVDVAIVLHTSERERAASFGGKKFEASCLHPLVNLGVERGVARVTGLDAFAENIIQLGLERIDERDRRRAGRHVLLLVFGKFDEVEIVSTVLHRLSAFHRTLGDSEERQSGRHGERLLAAGEQHVDAEFIHRNRLRGKRRDAIDNKHHLRELAQDGGDLRKRVAHATGGFVVDECECIESTLGEFGTDHVRLDGLSPIDLESCCFFAAALAHIKPLVGKRTAHAVEDFFCREIPDRALHDSPSGGSGEKDRALGSEEGLQAGLDAAVEFFEFRPAVADHRRAHGAEGFFGNFDRTRNEELDV